MSLTLLYDNLVDTLAVGGNALTGPIPSEIGRMTKLGMKPMSVRDVQ